MSHKTRKATSRSSENVYQSRTESFISLPQTYSNRQQTKTICGGAGRPNPPTQSLQKPKIRPSLSFEYSESRNACLFPVRTRIPWPTGSIAAMFIDVPVRAASLENRS